VSDRDARLNALAEALADGTLVDWDAAEAGANSDDEREQIRRMRVVGAVAAAHAHIDDRSAVATRWGPLEVLECIGRGRFGDVYRAWDRRLDREVALKLLRRADAPDAGGGSLFVAEGRRLAKVRHPGVVTVYGADRIDGRAGVWMEMVRGRTLEDLLVTRGPFAPAEGTAIGIDVLRVLEAVHASGLLHRDIKAQNVMREDTGRTVLMDFGTGRERDATDLGILAGTPLYLAPEVLAGGPATAASDIYAVGVLCHHLITGTFPVSGRTLRDVLAAHATTMDPTPGPELARAPDDVVAVIRCALERDPSRRFSSAGAMADALSATMAGGAVAGRPAPVRSRMLAASAIAAPLAALVLVALVLVRDDRPTRTDARMICERCDASLGAVTGDGRALVLPDLNSGDVVEQDVVSGAAHRLSLNDGGPGAWSSRASSPVPSPDARRIAYSLDGHAVFVTAVGAKRPGRPVLDRGAQGGIQPVAWSADGRALLVELIEKEDLTTSLAWLSIDSGSVSEVVRLGWRFRRPIDRASVSPDGQFIAYTALATNPARRPPYKPAATDAHLYLIPARGGTPIPITQGVSADRGAVWSRDGRRVLYLSDTSGTTDLWSVPLEHGAPTGRPVLVRKDIGDVIPLGVDPAGTYYYALNRPGVRETTVVDLATGGIERFVGSSPVWDPTGAALAFQRPRDGGVALFTRSLSTGAERAYEHEGFDGWPPMWFHDGRAIMKLSSEAAGPFWIRVDRESGDIRRVIANRGKPGVFTHMNIRTLAPDDTTIYFGAYRPPGGDILDRIVAANVATGEYREVVRLPGTEDTLPRSAQELAIAASPTGQQIALTRFDPSIEKSRLAVVGVDGRGYHDLYGPFAGSTLRNKLAWTHDGRFIFFAAEEGDAAFRIMKFDIERRQAQPTSVLVDALNSFDVAPDGSRIAYSTLTLAGARAEVWAMPLEKAE
jgi:serine/threonine-protein kinase